MQNGAVKILNFGQKKSPKMFQIDFFVIPNNFREFFLKRSKKIFFPLVSPLWTFLEKSSKLFFFSQTCSMLQKTRFSANLVIFFSEPNFPHASRHSTFSIFMSHVSVFTFPNPQTGFKHFSSSFQLENRHPISFFLNFPIERARGGRTITKFCCLTDVIELRAEWKSGK